MELFESSTVIAVLFLCFLYKAFVKREWIVDTALSTLIYPVKKEDGQLIPGPSWKWIDGQCLEKFLAGRELSQKWRPHGPVYRIWSGCNPEIVITRPEDVKAFHSDSQSHEKSTSSNGGWLFHQLLGDCMGLINGEPWKEIRNLFDGPFIRRRVTETTPFLLHAAEEYLRQIERTDDGVVVQLCAANSFSRFPFLATAEYLYGPLTASEKNDLWSLGQQSLALMGNVLAGGVFRFEASRWLRPQVHKQLTEFEKDWTEFNAHLVQTRRAGGQRSLVIVQAWEAVEEGKVSKKEIIQTLSEMLFANLDVSTHVLSWLVIFLARHTDIQQELRQEVVENKTCLMQLCDQKRSLLHFCFLESVRLRPFTVFTIPESSPQTKVLGGYIVPPNTSVVVDTLSINQNPQFWGDDCTVFNPHRLHSLSPMNLRYNLFTFGFGARKCLGQHFAEAMMKAFVCQLLLKYDVGLPISANKVDLDSTHRQETWVPISDVQITLSPVEEHP